MSTRFLRIQEHSGIIINVVLLNGEIEAIVND